jgi:hypothetical protein
MKIQNQTNGIFLSSKNQQSRPSDLWKYPGRPSTRGRCFAVPFLLTEIPVLIESQFMGLAAS